MDTTPGRRAGHKVNARWWLVAGMVIFLVPVHAAQSGGSMAWASAMRRGDVRFERPWLSDRFTGLDADRNGRLCGTELTTAWQGALFHAPVGQRRETADRNRDGCIDWAEARLQREWELLHWRKLGFGERLALPAWHNDLPWLIDHPEALEHLAGNAEYLLAHPELTAALADPALLHASPRLARTVYGNQRYLAVNPDFAIALYERTDWLNSHTSVRRVAYGDIAWLKSRPRLAALVLGNGEYLRAHPHFAQAFATDETWLAQNPDLAEAFFGYRQHTGYYYPPGHRHRRRFRDEVLAPPGGTPGAEPTNRHHNPYTPRTYRTPPKHTGVGEQR